MSYFLKKKSEEHMERGAYLGDGVYVVLDGHGGVVMSTGHHYEVNGPGAIAAQNVIFIEPEVLGNLCRVLKKWEKQEQILPYGGSILNKITTVTD